MGSPLKIKEDGSPGEQRGLARRERHGRAAARLYAIANALDGMSRANAARLAGMERQALRDAVLRYNEGDLAGLRDRPKGRPQRRLTEGEEAALAAVILRGPEPERDGCCAWTRGDLCRWMAAHFGKTYHHSSMTRVLRRMGFSRQKARPAHPQRDIKAQEQFRKRATRSSEGSGGSASGQAPAAVVSDAMRADTALAERSDWRVIRSSTGPGSPPLCRPRTRSTLPSSSVSHHGLSPRACPVPERYGCAVSTAGTQAPC
jgi:transposase